MKYIITAVLVLFAVVTVNADTDKPYQGQQERDIKALSATDSDGYLKGKGSRFYLAGNDWWY
jgi:hypothetical protein